MCSLEATGCVVRSAGEDSPGMAASRSREAACKKHSTFAISNTCNTSNASSGRVGRMGRSQAQSAGSATGRAVAAVTTCKRRFCTALQRAVQ